MNAILFLLVVLALVTAWLFGVWRNLQRLEAEIAMLEAKRINEKYVPRCFRK